MSTFQVESLLFLKSCEFLKEFMEKCDYSINDELTLKHSK